jgi:hypothetical protein
MRDGLRIRRGTSRRMMGLTDGSYLDESLMIPLPGVS